MQTTNRLHFSYNTEPLKTDNISIKLSVLQKQKEIQINT